MSDHSQGARDEAMAPSSSWSSSSNAANYAAPVGYQVNPRTGTLQIAISPPPLPGFFGAAATPALHYHQDADFLNRRILHLPLGWRYAYSFVLDSKVYVNGQASFFIDDGYASGLRYCTLKGVVYQSFGEPQPLPHDPGRWYTGLLRFANGDRQYFDADGRLMGMDDRFSNGVVFEYLGEGDVTQSRLARIVDAWGQATVFSYDDGRIDIAYPQGGRNAVAFSYLLDEDGYLAGYVDPLGQRTTIESLGGLVRHDLVSRVVSPNGTAFRYDYGALRFRLAGGSEFYRLDCVTGVHAASDGVTRSVSYDFDPEDDAHNFTGYPRFGVGAEEDNLLLGGDNDYLYRVRVNDGILVTEHVYNHLHLELETRTTTLAGQRLVSVVINTYPGEDAQGGFPLYGDLRRDFPNYQSPIQVMSAVYNDAGQRRQHVVQTDFDDHGRPREVRAYRSDSPATPSALLWKQVTSYDDPTEQSPDHYGLILTSERWDYTREVPPGGVSLCTRNTLTPDHRSVQTTATASGTGDAFAPTRQRRFEYDARGRITLEELAWIDGKPHVPQKSERRTTYVDELPVMRISIGNALGQATTTAIDATTGWVISVTDAVGASASFTYDHCGRRLTETDPLGVVTRTSWDDIGGKVTTHVANGYETCSHVNGFGDPVRSADSILPGQERTLSTQGYNALGQLSFEQGMLGEASRIDYGYDDRGQLATRTDALGNVTRYRVDAATQTETTWFNDHRISETAVKDEWSARYTYATDASGDRIESSTVRDGFDCVVRGSIGTAPSADWAETSYAYGADLQLNRYVLAGADGAAGSHAIERDLFGNVAQERVEINAAQGSGAPPLQARGDLALYNDLDQLVEERNPLGHSIFFTYDAAGRQATFKDHAGTVFTSRYRANNQIESVRYLDEDDRLVEKRFGYDARTHALTSIEESVGGLGSGAITRSYSIDGHLERVSYPDGKAFSIAYDAALARVDSVTDALGNKAVYSHDRWGRLSGVESAQLGQRVVFDYYERAEDAAHSGCLKAVTLNGAVRRTYRYDGFGRVAAIRTTQENLEPKPELSSVTFKYAATTGNVVQSISVWPAAPGSPPLDRHCDYQYNVLNQLTKATTTSQITGERATISYDYDAANNVLSEVRSGTAGDSTTRYTYDEDNKLLQVIGPTGTAQLDYDGNGNLVSDGRGGVYRYDRKGKLIRCSHASRGVDCRYGYYADELRAAKQPAGGTPIRYYYDGTAVPEIVNEVEGESKVAYLLVGGSRLTRKVQDSGVSSAQYLLSDGKDVTSVRDGSLALEAVYDYDPYGARPDRPATAAGVTPNPFQFTGQYTDAESDLVYLRSRYYHPGLKRFLTRDTATLLNRYGYGDGNPVNGSDPTGEIFGVDDALVAMAISAAIGAAVGAVVGAATTGTWKGAGYGALAGAVGGAVSFGVGAGITSGLTSAGVSGLVEGSQAAGFALGAATGAVSEAAGGATGQLAANLAGDDNSVSQAALMGAAFGGVIGGVTGARATFRYHNAVIGSPASIQRFGLDLHAAGPLGRPALIDAVSPRRLDRLGHGTITWGRIGAAIRRPGGQHEWLVVEHTARWRAMGYTIDEIRSPSMRTPTNALQLDMSGAGNWVLHNASGGHAFLNNAVGNADGVLGLHSTIRGLSHRVQVNGIIGNAALPSAFQGSLPPISRLIRMPFSIAYGVQGRVRL